MLLLLQTLLSLSLTLLALLGRDSIGARGGGTGLLAALLTLSLLALRLGRLSLRLEVVRAGRGRLAASSRSAEETAVLLLMLLVLVLLAVRAEPRSALVHIVVAVLLLRLVPLLLALLVVLLTVPPKAKIVVARRRVRAGSAVRVRSGRRGCGLGSGTARHGTGTYAGRSGNGCRGGGRSGLAVHLALTDGVVLLERRVGLLVVYLYQRPTSGRM